MNYDIQCYIRKDDGVSETVNTRDLFPGMYVLEANGLADYGKAKNIVTESYAEGPGLIAHVPDEIAREATDVTLKLLFLDDNGYGRYRQYDDFIAYIENAVFWYWDSVRGRAARLLMTEKSSPKENFHGSVEYIEAEVKLKNIDGKPTDVAWDFSWSEHVCQKVDGENNGYARRKTLVISLQIAGYEEQYSFTGAFGQYESVTDSELASMSADDYSDRMAGFNAYVVSDMQSHYGSFPISDITAGAYTHETMLCPLH